MTLRRTVTVAAVAVVAATGTFVTAFASTPAARLMAAGVDLEGGTGGGLGVCNVQLDGKGIDLTDTQLENAATIIRAGADHKVPEQGQVVALMTSMQEATLLNLASRAVPESLTYPHDDVAAGDHDSVGPFQQRAPWGPLADRMNVEASAGMFYTGGQGGQNGLLDIDRWQFMSPGRAAQAVQVSAFPDAYAKWEPLARALLSGSATTCEAGEGTVPAGQWVNPLEPGSYVILSPFGNRSCSWCSTFHKGVDMAPFGQALIPIHAAAAGTVIYSGVQGTYGQFILIDHGGGVTTGYAHQSRRIAQVGDTVEGGQQIGVTGTTGNSSGVHLHFETRINATPTDPVKYLRSKGVTL